MSKRSLLLLLIACLCAGSALIVSQPTSPPMPEGRRLRDIVAAKFASDGFLLGATTGSWAFDTPTGMIMDREFSYVTPENDFKQGTIHPDPDTWNWARADAWKSHIVEHGQVLRMHGPVSPQCSRWAQDDSRTPEELRQNMIEFATELYKRYNGVPGITHVDVVNEVTSNNEWHTNKPDFGWECPWFIIGQDTDKNKTPLFIKMAFELANQYAPDLKLIFNHHEDMNSEGSWRLIKDTIGYLREQGLRVDGIGWQAHVDTGWETPENLDKLRDLIDWAQEHDLEFHVTEASSWLKDGVSSEAFEAQAKTYAAIVEVLLEKRKYGIVGWNTWHIDDGTGWHQEWYGALFDSTYTAKPAYYAIQQVLEETR